MEPPVGDSSGCIGAARGPTLSLVGRRAATRGQVERLDAVFEEVGGRPGRKKCAAMEGLVQEGEELIGQSPPPEVLDAGLIAAAPIRGDRPRARSGLR